MQFIQQLHDIPPSYHVSQQFSWEVEVLYYKRAQETPVHQSASVCTVCRTALLLHPTTTMLVLQPQCQAQYNSHEHTVCQGWSGMSCSQDVLNYVAGHFQPSPERYDPMDMCLLLILLRVWSMYVHRKSLMHNPTRVRKETRDLVMSLWPESQRKFVLRSIATSARSMGVRILCTTWKIVVSMRKADHKKPISTPLRKAERNLILQRNLLLNKARSWKSLR